MNELNPSPTGESPLAGTPIGYVEQGDVRRPVFIPQDLRFTHVHIIGRTGSGKSTLMERMVLDDIRRGAGVAVLDPHGGLIERLLCLVSETDVPRVVYFNPGDPKWVPIWNPLRCIAGLPLGRVADDLVCAFRSFMTGRGDRLEYLLQHAIFGVLHLPDGSLLDVANLLRQKSEESEKLRARILALVDQPMVRSFWQTDFDRYRDAELTPLQHKLSKLLTDGTVARMLSQSETSFEFRDVMDRGKILLVDLSDVRSEVREVLGCFILSLLHLAAVARSSARPETRKPFHIFCDEAHRFMTETIEDLIAETRTFKVSLCLSHQYMSQLTSVRADVLSSVGTTIVFSAEHKDAQQLAGRLPGKGQADELTNLGLGEAVACIGSKVARFRTYPPPETPQTTIHDEIIRYSHAHYCKPALAFTRDAGPTSAGST